MKRAAFVFPVVAAIAAVLIGCAGVSEKALDQAQQKIDFLKSKGLPDSLLSGPRTKLYEARDQLQRTNYSAARKAAAVLKVMLKQAQTSYDAISHMKPTVDSLMRVAGALRPQVTGLQLHKLDSMAARVTVLVQNESLYQAKVKADSLVMALPSLKQDEDKAKQLRSEVPGVWECINNITSDVEKSVNAVEKKIFTFGADGKVTYVESAKGRAEKNLKKDYEFLSWGTYDFAGDTIHCFINRFASKRQLFEVRHEQGSKEWWEKQPPGAVYDSAIVDHSQDRWITLADLKQDFKKR
jgi:hypothetical protein